MALKQSTGELPPGATLLNSEDAIEYQWKLILDWKPRSDVWPFSYGIGLLGGLGTLSGLYINQHYRNRLKLHNYGRLSTYLPIVILPTMMSTLFHQQLVTNDILIQRTKCPICIELRSAAIQTFFGVIYPAALAPLASFMFATRHLTYDVPSVVTHPRKVLALWQKFTKPVGHIFLTICAFHAIAAMAVTYYETKSFYLVQKKLDLLEKYYDERKQQFEPE